MPVGAAAVRATAHAVADGGAATDAVLDAAFAHSPPDLVQYPLFRLMTLPRAAPRRAPAPGTTRLVPHVALSPSMVFFEVVTQTVALTDVIFARVGAGYFTFPQVLAAAVTRCRLALARAPVTLEAFAEILWADEAPWLRAAAEVAVCPLQNALCVDYGAAAGSGGAGSGAGAPQAAVDAVGALAKALALAAPPAAEDFAFFLETDGLVQAVAPRPAVPAFVVPTVFDLGDRLV